MAAYEAGRRQPSLRTLERLLGAAGSELVVRSLPGGLTTPDLRRAAERLAAVLALAEQLPFRRARNLGYPRLPTGT